MNKEEQQKIILAFLENAYTGARTADDAETMTRISRAITAFNLPVYDDVVISTYGGAEDGNRKASLQQL